VAWGPTFVPSGILIYPAVWPQDMGGNMGGVAVPLSGGEEMGPHLTQCGWAETYLRTKRHLDSSSRLATTDMGRNLGAALPLLGGSWVFM